jgi:hypothetical protein
VQSYCVTFIVNCPFIQFLFVSDMRCRSNSAKVFSHLNLLIGAKKICIFSKNREIYKFVKFKLVRFWDPLKRVARRRPHDTLAVFSWDTTSVSGQHQIGAVLGSHVAVWIFTDLLIVKSGRHSPVGYGCGYQRGY